MCRLLAYKGPPVILNDLLYKPEHSIINQSYNAKEMEEPLNGDGFGIGWYAREIDPGPAVFKSVQPAWNNKNLQYISPKISSKCVIAHVRAASVGSVSELNCHPFHCNNFLMMHNGGIDNFQEIRRPLLGKLSDPQFQSIEGQTDSEHIFALFLEHLSADSAKPDLQTRKDALKATIDDIIALKTSQGLTESSYLNIVITDGLHIIGCRYVTDPNETPLSLHFAKGEKFECENNMYKMRESKNKDDQQGVLIVSEKLNAHAQEWETVPANHFFTVDEAGSMAFEAV